MSYRKRHTRRQIRVKCIHALAVGTAVVIDCVALYVYPPLAPLTVPVTLGASMVWIWVD